MTTFRDSPEILEPLPNAHVPGVNGDGTPIEAASCVEPGSPDVVTPEKIILGRRPPVHLGQQLVEGSDVPITQAESRARTTYHVKSGPSGSLYFKRRY